jgi:hypothetical protein
MATKVLEVVNVSHGILYSMLSFCSNGNTSKNGRLIFGAMRPLNDGGVGPFQRRRDMGYVSLIVDGFRLVLESRTLYKKFGALDYLG